jgi:quercetin dioxygenase-like cupin family protein
MAFAHCDFKRGSSIHEHFHPQKEVCEVIEGELEVTSDGLTRIARPGIVAIVPANARHSTAVVVGRASTPARVLQDPIGYCFFTSGLA